MTVPLLGDVSNDFSNFVSVLAIDAEQAPAWRGASKAAGKSDFARANEAAGKSKCEITVGRGGGVVCGIGGSGRAGIHRVDATTLVFVDHYAGSNDGDAEAEFLRTLTEAPTAKRPKRLGSVEVTSGVLAFVALAEPATKLAAKEIARVAASDKARKTPFGLLVPLPNGAYDIWRDELRAKGAFGSIEGRIRIVRKGTKVTAGEPLATPPKKDATTAKTAKAAPNAKSGRTRRIVDGWGAVSSFTAAPGGRLIAGEKGGTHVCCWSADGVLVWQSELPAKTGGLARYSIEVLVQLAGSSVLVCCPYAGIWELAAETGKIVKAHSGTEDVCALAVTPDGEHVVVRVGTETEIRARATMKTTARLEEYCNVDEIALTPDGKRFAVNGQEVHVYAREGGGATLVCTFKPKTPPIASAISPDGERVACGSDDGLIRLFQANTGKPLAELDPSPARSRKPAVSALAWSADGLRLATGTTDGTVKVWDVRTKKATVIVEKLDTSIPDTGARDLAQLTFVDDALVVSAGLTKEPAGLSVYAV